MTLRSNLFLLLTLFSNACIAQVYVPTGGEFSIANNPSGVWGYGYSTSLGGAYSSYNNTGTYVSPTLQRWLAPSSVDNFMGVYFNTTGSTNTQGTVSLDPNGIALHPGDTSGEYSILRFTAPAAGQFIAVGDFFSQDTVGATTDVHILVNGGTIFSDTVSGNGVNAGATFSESIFLNIGDTIDFAVGFGPGPYNFDMTGIDLEISVIPEPSTYALFVGAACLGLTTWKRRKKTVKC